MEGGSQEGLRRLPLKSYSLDSLQTTEENRKAPRKDARNSKGVSQEGLRSCYRREQEGAAVDAGPTQRGGIAVNEGRVRENRRTPRWMQE